MTTTDLPNNAVSDWRAELVQARLHRPELAAEVATSRVRRNLVGPDGNLFIVAADFAGRGILGAGGDELALARRAQLLERLQRALSEDTVDGILATPDVVDDLLFLDGIRAEQGLPKLLDRRLLIGSVNRGGLLGSAFELDDTNTGHSVAGAIERGLDAVKVMVRIGLDDPQTGATLLRTADVVREGGRRRLPVFVETFPVRREGGSWVVVSEAKEIARTVAVASALGDDTSYTWLKVPYCADFEIVAGTTSCPITILGGDPANKAEDISRTVSRALEAGENVRGAVIGRRALFPSDGDVAAACKRIGSVIHGSDVGTVANT